MGTPVSAQQGVQDVRIVGIKAPNVTRTARQGGVVVESTAGDWDILPTSN